MQRLEPATESIVVTDGGGSVDICVNITWAAHTVAPKYTQGLKTAFWRVGFFTAWPVMHYYCTAPSLNAFGISYIL